MQPSQQSSYNRDYYLTHPELKERARERERKKREEARSFRSVKTSSRKNLKEKKSENLTSRSALFLELLFLPILLTLITFLLLKEMVTFYSEPNSAHMLAWIKALAIEGVILTFSFLSDSSPFKQVLYKGLAVALCIFSTYAMCSKHYSDGMTSIRSDQEAVKTITDLETSIKRKQVQADELFAKGWISAGRKMENTLDALRTQLIEARAKIINAKPAVAAVGNTIAQIVFRVLLMCANILAAHRLGHCLKVFESFKIENEISGEYIRVSKQTLKFQKPQEARGEQQKPKFQFDFMRPWKFSSG